MPVHSPGAARIMLIGDPHIRSQNISQVEAFIDSLAALASHTCDIDACVILGDIFHTMQPPPGMASGVT